MKAKDYFKKYEARLVNDETAHEAACALVQEFARECGEMMKARNAKSDKAVNAIIEELNNKWNALAGMFDREVLKRNGWRDYFNFCVSQSLQKGG